MRKITLLILTVAFISGGVGWGYIFLKDWKLALALAAILWVQNIETRRKFGDK